MEAKTQIKDTIIPILSSASIALEYFTIFLKLINAPPSLEGIIEVSDRFIAVFQYIKAVSCLEAIDGFLSEV